MTRTWRTTALIRSLAAFFRSGDLDAAVERHPATRGQRQVIGGVPGLCPDGEPLSLRELRVIGRLDYYTRAEWDAITEQAEAFSEGNGERL